MPIDTKSADLAAEALVEDTLDDNPSIAFWLDRLLDNELDGIEALKAQMDVLTGTPGWAAFTAVLRDYDKQIVDDIVEMDSDDSFTRGTAKGLRLALAFADAVNVAHQHITESAGADEETGS